MNVQWLKKGCLLVIICYTLAALAFPLIAADQLHYRTDTSGAVSAATVIGEMTRDMTLRQPIRLDADEITGVSLYLSTYGRDNTSRLRVRILDSAGEVLGEKQVSCRDLSDNAMNSIVFDEAIAVDRDAGYELQVTSPDGMAGDAVTAWYGNSVSAARNEVALLIPEEERLLVNDLPVDGKLCYSLQTRSHLWFGRVYPLLAIAVGICLAVCCVRLLRKAERGESALVLRMLAAFCRYGFLMKQLIGRDFKTKYKRSFLGVLWSFLNPLLTMTVQYIIFSTLFKSDIPNFPLYLLTGIVCFNFFNEACGMSLMSIVGNASLITKVYVPKYIYTLSRVLSSAVNLLLAMIPLCAVMLLTGARIRPALLLLPFGLICLLALGLGVGMFLATAMVFFRDTQFLWGVVSMLWMYATPIFYPESIIGERFMILFKCNPLYHIIRFIRIILMDGISPEPKAYLLCMIASFVPLVIGAVVFKKNQDKFILNL